MATPREVRREMSKLGLTVEIHKSEGSWYVVGDETIDWHERCLYTPQFFGEAKYWAEVVKDMSASNRKS